jgi:hypothetical protein
MESQRAIDLSQASGLLFVIPDDLNSECSGFMRFAARLTQIDDALAHHGSQAARSKQRGKMTLTYAADGTALSEYNQLATWLVNTGTYKKTCTLTADYTKKLGG